MTQILRPAISLMVLFTLLLGLGYPLAITGIAQLAFPFQANGSLVRNGDRVIGSELIGQTSASDTYFWPRPSATGDSPYNAGASSGTNLGPTSAKLKSMVAAEVEKLRNSGIRTPVPADAATYSGSGLDPHISPDYARLQIPRIAKARGIPEARLNDILGRHIEGPSLGFIGEPRVNVLLLNLALDSERPV
ncbi:MAG: potassium-transporting ATPase subunit KdpC [Rhizobium sp.]|nr:potassium-transporting ATPase subunit KdpC [Rhizobium sp.]